jgi:hypothetical protein
MKMLLLDLWNDLRAKRLWPVAALLLAALVATPVVLSTDAEEPAPPAPPEERGAWLAGFLLGLGLLAAAVALAAALTHVEFPAHYFDVVAREPAAIAIVALRNLALLAVVVLAVRQLHPRGQEDLLDSRRPAVAVGLDQ